MTDDKNNINNRVAGFETELMALQKKYNLELIPTPEFPQYRILPPEIQLALTIIKKEGVQYRFAYIEGKGK